MSAQHDFAAWTKSTAFHINLTEWAIQELLITEHYTQMAPQRGVSMNRLRTYYLLRRGLIERAPGEAGNWILSEAGIHVAALVRLAGFKSGLESSVPAEVVPVGV